MDRPSISHLFAHYITNSCCIIIPHFNSCARSRYPVTINHQNKETDFSVWVSHFGRFKKDKKGERGEERSRGEQETKTRAGLSHSPGKVCHRTTTVLLSKARDPDLQQAVCWALVWGAEHLLLPLQQSLTQDWASVSETSALPAAPSTRHMEDMPTRCLLQGLPSPFVTPLCADPHLQHVTGRWPQRHCDKRHDVSSLTLTQRSNTAAIQKPLF